MSGYNIQLIESEVVKKTKTHRMTFNNITDCITQIQNHAISYNNPTDDYELKCEGICITNESIQQIRQILSAISGYVDTLILHRQQLPTTPPIDLNFLTSLTINFSPLKNFNFNAHNLTKLVITNCTYLQDFSFIDNMKQLEHLEITNCKLLKSITLPDSIQYAKFHKVPLLSTILATTTYGLPNIHTLIVSLGTDKITKKMTPLSEIPLHMPQLQVLHLESTWNTTLSDNDVALAKQHLHELSTITLVTSNDTEPTTLATADTDASRDLTDEEILDSIDFTTLMATIEDNPLENNDTSETNTELSDNKQSISSLVIGNEMHCIDLPNSLAKLRQLRLRGFKRVNTPVDLSTKANLETIHLEYIGYFSNPICATYTHLTDIICKNSYIPGTIANMKAPNIGSVEILHNKDASPDWIKQWLSNKTLLSLIIYDDNVSILSLTINLPKCIRINMKLPNIQKLDMQNIDELIMWQITDMNVTLINMITCPKLHRLTIYNSNSTIHGHNLKQLQYGRCGIINQKIYPYTWTYGTFNTLIASYRMRIWNNIPQNQQST